MKKDDHGLNKSGSGYHFCHRVKLCEMQVAPESGSSDAFIADAEHTESFMEECPARMYM